jgi:hypothetical protein
MKPIEPMRPFLEIDVMAFGAFIGTLTFKGCAPSQHSEAITKHDLEAMESRIMGKIKEYSDQQSANFAEIGGSVDSLVESVNGLTGDIQRLKETIDQLQNSPGQITPEDQALLDSSQSQAAALSTKLKGVKDALKALDEATAAPSVDPLPATDG